MYNTQSIHKREEMMFLDSFIGCQSVCISLFMNTKTLPSPYLLHESFVYCNQPIPDASGKAAMPPGNIPAKKRATIIRKGQVRSSYRAGSGS